ncbi:hypothetical protein AB0B85_14305 [Micromonospora sp. NPDC049044]|uniref:hypothetical protein n=1 Tax=Micromonospora sp. NPDC049044 TaxID=3154827 RepID=UPI0033DC8CB7
MGVLAECPELFTIAGPSMFLYQQAGSGSKVHDDLVYDLARQSITPGDVALLIPVSALTSTSLRAYLHDLVAADGRLVVVPFQPGASGLLDLDSTVRVQDGLGIVLAVSGSAVEEGVSAGLEARLVPIESTQAPGTTGRSANVYRLLPEALAANHRQLAELVTGDQPPSLAKLVSHSATGGRHTAGGDGFLMGDLSPLAGVYYATFGELPHLSIAELLASTSPLSRPRLNDALGLNSMPMPLANVLREFESGRAAAALVHASSGSPTPGSFWVLTDDAGQLRWTDGTQPVAAVVLDGAVDRQAAVLEHPHSEFVLVRSGGVPYRPELPAEPVWTPRVSANARRRGNTILLGPDRPSATTEKIMADLDHHDGPSILVEVRRGPRSGHGTTLDELTAESLHHTLAKNPAISLVVGTEGNAELEFIVADQHGRSLVHPTMTGLGKGWDVQGGRSAYRELYRNLTDGAFARAVALALSQMASPSQLVSDFVTQPTWKAAEKYLKKFSAELRNLQVLRELTDLESARVANGKRTSRFGNGPIEKSPFYRPDRTTGAFRVLIQQDLRAQGSRAGSDARPLEPQHAWLMEAVEPYTRTVDSTLPLGYLTRRRVDAARLGQEVGDHVMDLLWVRELMQAVRDVDKTQFYITDASVVVGAKDELEQDRAGRRPGQPEIFRALAAVVEAIADIVAVDRTGADWRDRLKVTDCLTGLHRAYLHGIIANIIVPAFQAHQAQIRSMQDRVNACYDKAGV